MASQTRWWRKSAKGGMGQLSRRNQRLDSRPSCEIEAPINIGPRFGNELAQDGGADWIVEPLPPLAEKRAPTEFFIHGEFNERAERCDRVPILKEFGAVLVEEFAMVVV